MKINTKYIGILVSVLIFFLIGSTMAGELTGKEVIEKAEEKMDYGNFQGKGKMVIFTTGGDKRTLAMEMWGQGTEKYMMKYYEPSRVEGVTFLFLEDDIWSYFPRTGRVRHLASHVQNQKMMGSSFSYQDFSNEAFDDYKCVLLKEEKLDGESCYVVEGKGRSDEAGYDRVVCWIRKDFQILKTNYFKDQQKVKIMTTQTFHKVDGKLRPKRIVMKDLLEDNKTVFEYLEIETGIQFPPNFFHKRNLKRISHK